MSTQNQSTDLTEFDALKANVAIFVQPVKTITVKDAAGNAVAAGTLRTIKELQKQLDAKRVAAVKPLNDRVNLVNDYAKEVAAPLEEAEKYVKRVMADFATEDARRRAEEQRRLDDERKAEEKRQEDERKKVEAAAEKERQRLAAEAEREAEKERQRIAKEAEAERKSLEAQQKKEAKTAKLFGIDPEQQKRDADAARRELEEKNAQAQRDADARAQKARDDAARQAEEKRIQNQARLDREAKEREALRKSEERRLESERPKNVRQVAVWTITDRTKVPAEFWMVDESKLGAAIRDGRRDIPGVEIKMEAQVSAR